MTERHSAMVAQVMAELHFAREVIGREHRDEIQSSSMHNNMPIVLIKVSSSTDSYSSQDQQTFTHQCSLYP